MEFLAKVKGTFPGGVHPADSKEFTQDKAIENGPVGKELSIHLQQHIGAPCRPLVSKGDKVEAGQKIGESDSFVSACVHSPVKGTVKEISLQPHPIMGRSMAIVITTDPEQATSRNIAQLEGDVDIDRYSQEQICDAVKEAGIVGMGGAGFPTRVKLEPNAKAPKEAMIVNGCECEPYITCDYRVMLERTKHLIYGIRLAKKASESKKVFIAIEDNKPEAIKAVSQAVEKYADRDDISVVSLKTKYPQGGERQLIKAVLDKQVPTGGIPPMIGVLVLNISTSIAIAEAVVCGLPLTHRVVTVSGQAVSRPGNYLVPIGTKAGELLDYAGSVTQKSAKVVLGGPMTGASIADLETPIMKASGAITILTKQQIGRAKFAQRQTPCIRCGRCIEICPEGLNPTKIAHAVKYEDMELAQEHFISACIECGCCSYVCPAKIELTGYIKTGKIFLARQKKKMPQ